MTAEELRAGLRCGRSGCDCARPRGKVHCPGHDDQTPSLSVDEKDGRILVHDFSGRCSQEEVIAALRERGLWDGKPSVPQLSRLARRQGRVTLEGPLVSVVRFIRSHVVLPSMHAEVAIALWVAHAHALDAFDCSPYLVVTSPEKRSGKTRLLEVLELLVPRPWRVIQPSEAVLFRKIAAQRPVLLLDEADVLFNGRAAEQYEPLRAILNAGWRRGAVVSRCVPEGKAMQLVDFDVFGAKAVAVIGNLPDTVEDRAVVLRLDRATPAEQRCLRRLRFKEAEAEAAPIRDALAKWAEAALPRLREARPSIPEALDGRAADAWEPLLAIAEDAGDGWAVAAWEAALALSTGAAREDDSERVRLLADVRRVFEEKGAERLATTELIEALVEDEAAPWGDLRGRRLSPQGLARLLRPFGVSPAQWRDGARAGIRGYVVEMFEEPWSRYLPPSPGFEPLQPLQRSPDAAFSHFEQPLQTPLVADGENGANADGARVVADVAVATPPGGEGAAGDASDVLGEVEVIADVPDDQLVLEDVEGG